MPRRFVEIMELGPRERFVKMCSGGTHCPHLDKSGWYCCYCEPLRKPRKPQAAKQTLDDLIKPAMERFFKLNQDSPIVWNGVNKKT
jgi:hypothetical protein